MNITSPLRVVEEQVIACFIALVGVFARFGQETANETIISA